MESQVFDQHSKVKFVKRETLLLESTDLEKTRDILSAVSMSLLYTKEQSSEGETHKCQHTLSLASIPCGDFNTQRAVIVFALQEIYHCVLREEALARSKATDSVVLWV